MGLLQSSKVIFSIITVYLHYHVPEFDCLLVSLWFPFCPLLLSLSFRKICCLFFALYPGINGVVVPRRPRPHTIADVYFIISSQRLIWNQMSVRKDRAVSLAPLHTYHVEVALQLNSFTIPHHINFLWSPGSLSYPCQHKGTIYPLLLLDVFFVCTHHSQFHVEVTCKCRNFERRIDVLLIVL